MATALTPARRSNFFANDNGNIIDTVMNIITIARKGPDTLKYTLRIKKNFKFQNIYTNCRPEQFCN
jgi:hypothetical protein